MRRWKLVVVLLALATLALASTTLADGCKVTSQGYTLFLGDNMSEAQCENKANEYNTIWVFRKKCMPIRDENGTLVNCSVLLESDCLCIDVIDW
jgi:hypothetical protein